MPPATTKREEQDMEINVKYIIDIYAGGTYCGNGSFESIEDCLKFLKEDVFCDEGKIIELETERRCTARYVDGMMKISSWRKMRRRA